MQLREERQRVAHGFEMERQRLGDAEGVKAPRELVVLEQFLVADRKQRSAQQRKYRQLIVGPFNRHQRGAQRLDLLAVMERPAADEQVTNAARFERVDVRTRHVGAIAEEATEKQADVARLNRDARRRE